jgi:hypothetical protein
MTAACWRLYYIYMMRPARRLCCVPSGRREMQDARMCVWKPHVENSPLIASSRTRTTSQFTPCALLSVVRGRRAPPNQPAAGGYLRS